MKEKIIILRWLPLFVFLALWQFFAVSSTETSFLFSSPFEIIKTLVTKIGNGELIVHFLFTAFEATTGLLLGMLIGSISGFILLFYPRTAKLSTPYILALSSIPVFAIAPMMIIWFGTGLFMKIALAFFSTVFVAIFQAFQGGKNINSQASEFFDICHASRKAKFWKLIVPSSIEWLLQSLKLNSSLAILGAFIGEFIASEKGLGYIIIKASGLYDVSYVLATVVCIMILTSIFNFFSTLITRNKLTITRKLAFIS